MWDRAKGLFGGLILAAALIAIHVALRAAGKEFFLTQLTMSIYYAVVVLGLSLLMGYAGQVSLGHGAFFAIGGYTTAILTTSNFLPWQDRPLIRALAAARVFVMKQDVFGEPLMAVAPWAAFIAAMIFTFVVAVLIGYSALRLKGHYLAMATLGFGLIVQAIVRGSTFTGASDGISSVPPFPLFGLAISGKSALRTQNYYIAGAVLLIVIVLLWNLLHSRVGRALQAIHDRETAANAMGINTSQYKLKAFVTSAILAAVAGVLFTHYTGGIGPSEAGAIKSVRYVALAAAGGMGNIWTVAVTSITLNFLSLRGWFGSYDNAVFGVILIAIISIAPEGPAKQINEWVRQIARRSKSATEDRDASA